MADINNSNQYPKGSVVRIKLKDFLTYDEIEVKPASGLNLLLGPNGTGKSSIVCALCLGLAGHPSILGRSSTLSDYIKHDRNTAIIEIELSSGNEQRNPVITTKYRRTGGNEYYINNKLSKREDVREFVKGYHIQVDNLCQFLAQDKVVEFARQSKQDLLWNTEKAAGTFDLFEQHMKLKDRLDEGKDKRTQLAQVTRKKVSCQQKAEALRKPYEQYEEYEKRRKKLDLLEKKRPWVEYELSKEELNEVKTELDELKKQCEARAAAVRPLKDELDQAVHLVQATDKELSTQKVQFERLKAALVPDLENCRRKSRQVTELKESLEATRDDFRKKTEKIQTFETAIAALREKMGQLRDENLQDEINQVDRDITKMNRDLDELEARQQSIEGSLTAEQTNKGRFEYQLKTFENRQEQQLQNLRRMDTQVYNAYIWYRDNRDKFKGAVWLPALEMRVPDKNNIKYIEACIAKRDLFSFVFERFDDLQKFLNELERQNIRVGGGEVPPDHVEINAALPADLRQLGFRDFVCNMFEAPDGLKKYLTKLSHLNKIPVGSAQVEQNLERTTNALRGRYWKFLTPTKQLSMNESRYGGGITTQNQPLREPTILIHTTGTGDEAMEHELRTKLEQSVNAVDQLRNSLNQVSEENRELKRRKTALNEQKGALKNRAGERASVQSQITFKERGLREARASLPDMARAEERYNADMKKILVEKFDLLGRIAAKAEEINGLLAGRSTLCLKRAAHSITVVKKRQAYDESRASIVEDERKVHKLQTEYNEKKGNVEVLLRRARQSIGLTRGNEIPGEIEEAFKQLPDELDELDDAIEEQRTLLRHCGHVDESIVVDYQRQTRELRDLELQESVLQQAVNSWETDITGERDKWLAELQKLIDVISENFSRFMDVLGCAGEVGLDKPEDVNDFMKYGVLIKVKFRETEPLRELDPQHQSGGERSVSTMLYMLALQALSHVPFRCVDEINQGMDPINERKVFEMMTKLLSSGTSKLNCTQYFMLTPKLLHGLPMGENIQVWLIHNGNHMIKDDQWNMKKFLKRRKALNQARMTD